MSKKRVKSREDLINEPKVVALPRQTYSYGQTPVALCKQHFKEIAEQLNMSVDELARNVLNKSVGDQLMLLKDFYKSKYQETDAIYDPLLQLYSSVESPAVSIKMNNSRPLILSSESETEDKTNKTKPPKKTSQQHDKKPINRQFTASNMTSSRIQRSIEDTIAFTINFETKDNTALTLDPEPMIEPEIPKISENILQSNNEPNVTKESTKEPKTVMNAGPSKTKISEEDDFETFLFGKSTAKSKPPPRKKYQQHSLDVISQSQNELYTLDSPSSSQYSTPGLTFDSTSYSPSSHQRDLLSVVRDIVAVQKVVDSGKKLGDSLSVSDTIRFTN